MRGAKFQFSAASKSMVITFTSFGEDKVPARGFEYEGATTGILASSRMFLRDLWQHWYLGGVLDFSTSYEDTVRKIRSLCEDQGVERVAVIGASEGGYAALRLGADICADLVLAFVPQTNLKQEWRERNGDSRWSGKMAEINSIGFEGLDIVEVFAVRRPTAVEVYFDPAFHLDRLHADRLAQFEEVKLIEVMGQQHRVAAALAKAGDITRRLQAFEALSTPEPIFGTVASAAGQTRSVV